MTAGLREGAGLGGGAARAVGANGGGRGGPEAGALVGSNKPRFQSGHRPIGLEPVTAFSGH